MLTASVSSSSSSPPVTADPARSTLLTDTPCIPSSVKIEAKGSSIR